jgi:hypothetical protein
MSTDTDQGGPQGFVRYEVVQTWESHPTTGVHRYHIYGIRENGSRVGLDYLYLRDHDEEIAALTATVETLHKENEKERDRADNVVAVLVKVRGEVEMLEQKLAQLKVAIQDAGLILGQTNSGFKIYRGRVRPIGDA